MTEQQKELSKHFREQQVKYIYYIIALCVAAIGFTVHETLGLPVNNEEGERLLLNFSS